MADDRRIRSELGAAALQQFHSKSINWHFILCRRSSRRTSVDMKINWILLLRLTLRLTDLPPSIFIGGKFTIYISADVSWWLTMPPPPMPPSSSSSTSWMRWDDIMCNCNKTNYAAVSVNIDLDENQRSAIFDTWIVRMLIYWWLSSQQTAFNESYLRWCSPHSGFRCN